MTRIVIDVDDEATRQLWEVVGELAERLPHEWVLIGGLMVQLHVLEHGSMDVRLTVDIDVLGQARPSRSLPAIDQALRDDGFHAATPDLDGYAHRYERNGVIVDVLAPDGVKPPPELDGGRRAIGVPGGSQALNRAETVTVVVGRQSFEVRRPSLLGAILIKARSLMVHSDPDAQREDLLRLLALVDDPRATAGELRKTERRWLRDAEERLAFAAVATLDGEAVRRAELAYRLLVRDTGDAD